MRSSTIGCVRVAERVAGGGVLEADGGDDVAGEDGVLVLAVVGVHLQDAADALLAVLGRVRAPWLPVGELAGVDAEVGELADVGVAHDLERQRGERLAVVGRALELLDALAGRCPVIGGTSSGLGQVVDDRVEQGLHALVLERRAAQHGHDVVGDRCRRGARVRRSSAVISSSPTYFSSTFSSNWLDDVDELVAPVLGVGLRASAGISTVSQLSPMPSSQTSAFISSRSMTPAEVALGADRQLDDGDGGVEAVLDHVDGSGRSRRRCGPSC